MTKKFALYLIVIILGIAALVLPKNIAVQADETVDLYVRVEGSLDNGATWHNFQSTVDGGNESLTISGGDTLLIRVKTWNETVGRQTTGAEITASLSDSDYISNVELISLDDDTDSNEYSGNVWSGGGTATIDIMPGDVDSGYQSITAEVTFAENIPAGYSMTGSVTITDEGTSGPYLTFNPFIKRVLANGLNRVSSIRIITADATTTPPATTLPETGANLY